MNTVTYIACLASSNDLQQFKLLKKQMAFSHIYCHGRFTPQDLSGEMLPVISLSELFQLHSKRVVIFSNSHDVYEKIREKLSQLDIPTVHYGVYLKTIPAFYEMKDLASYKREGETFIDAGCGNRIVFGSIPKGEGVIVFNGTNNLVQIGENCCFYRRAYLRTNGSNNKIFLGDGVKSGNTEALSKNEYGLSIVAHKGSTVKIGAFCTLGGVAFRSSEAGIIDIGPHCMFSWDVHIWQMQGHMLCDMNQNGERINLNKNITLGTHVWVGKSTTVFAGTSIGSNSVVGYGALITGGDFPEHCTIAGFPAKKSRDNICWARDMTSEELTDIYQCTDQEGLKIWLAEHAEEEKTE